MPAMHRDEPDPPDGAVSLVLSGVPTAQRGDRAPMPLALRDAALLAWLALEGPTPRNRLAQLLWPESAADAARNALRQRVFQLKKQLGVSVLDGSATLALAPDVTHDLDDADTVLGAGGEAIGGEFDAWLGQQRARRRDRVRRSLAELCEMAERAGDWADALSHAGELLALEPLSEVAHRRAMRLHYLAGDRTAALVAFDRCERVLKDEIGARPTPETLALLASIEASGTSDAASGGGTLAIGSGAPPASVLRPPRMVGRRDELAQLAQGWAAGQIVAVIGEAGLGKSRLLQDFAAPNPGVVHVAARPGDAGVPLATLARLLRAVTSLASQGSPLEPAARHEIARVLPEFDVAMPRHTGEGQRLVLQQAVQALLSAQTGLAGVLVDDLHFADEASLDMLRALIDEPAGSPDTAPGMRWALAYRPAEAASPLQALHDAMTEQARWRPLPLHPLDEAALAELVDSLGLPGVSGRALAPGLLQRTGGNPLFVLETLRSAWVEGALSGASASQLPRPATVGRLIERRLQRLSPDALALARIASIAGPDFDIGLAEAVIGTSALHLTDALVELEAAQVLRGTQFAHDLVADAVSRGIPPTVARHCHGRIAQWLGERGCASARLAHHWLQSGTPAQAVAPLLQAARDAGATLRPKEQCDFLREAARLQREQGDRVGAFDTLHALLEVQVDVARDATALALCDELRSLADTPAQRARALQQHAWLLFNRSETDAARRSAEAYLSHAETLAEDPLVADAHHVTGLVHAMLTGDAREALIHMRQAAPTVVQDCSARERAEFHGSLAVVLVNNGELLEAATENEHALAAARECGYTAQQAIVLGNQALNLRAMGRLGDAQRCVTDAQRLHLQHDRLDGANNTLAAAAALIAFERGHYGVALQRLDEAEALLGRQGALWLPLMHARRAAVWMSLGQTARARQALGSADDPTSSPPFVRALHGLTAARLQLLLGERNDEALARAARLAPTAGRLEVRVAVRIEQALRMPAAEGVSLLDDAIALTRHGGYRASLLAATIRAAPLHLACEPADADAAGRLAETALTLHADCDIILDHPPALWLSLGKTLLAIGRDEAAAQLLRVEAEALQALARTHVPPEFRDSFLNRNPANRELLALQHSLR
jgi:DNA-binding SARP family transcriptional activator/tetratricopeptide (TPR) repeat protein